jgi:hypothetical protein
VNAGNLQDCQDYVEFLREEGEPLAWDYIYQKVYLHACLRKQKHIVDWLLELYKELSVIEQIAIRQIFPYGRYLLAK